jgi:hypothetical protein
MDLRLREDADVTLNLPSTGVGLRVRDFDAVVVALVDSGIVLAPRDVVAELLPAEIDDVFLSFVDGRQLVGLKGTLTHDRRGLRFRVSDGVRMRRRGYSRVDAELPVTVRRADGSDPCRGVTVDVAPEGLLVSARLAVALDDVLELLVTLPAAERPLRLRARVVRHGGGRIALRLLRDAPESRAALAEFVVERRLDAFRAAHAAHA